MYDFLPYLNFATVDQRNNAVANNIAVGSPFATQTTVQLQSNSANIAQGGGLGGGKGK